MQPGVYDFNEYFALYRSNNARRFSYETRVSFGGLYNGTRNGYAFAPTLRLNEHLNASVGLQINDIELPQVSYVSKLIATRVNYAFSTKVFLEHTGAVQHRQPAVEFERAVQRHSPPAQRHFSGLTTSAGSTPRAT